MDASSYTRLNALILGGSVAAAVVSALAANSALLKGDLVFDTTDNATPAVQLSVDGEYPMDALGFEEDGDILAGSGDILFNPYRNASADVRSGTRAYLTYDFDPFSATGGKANYDVASIPCPTTTTGSFKRIEVQCHNVGKAVSTDLDVVAAVTSSGSGIWNNKLTGSGVRITPGTQTGGFICDKGKYLKLSAGATFDQGGMCVLEAEWDEFWRP